MLYIVIVGFRVSGYFRILYLVKHLGFRVDRACDSASGFGGLEAFGPSHRSQARNPQCLRMFWVVPWWVLENFEGCQGISALLLCRDQKTIALES